MVRSGACYGGEGGLLWDQHRGGCPAAGSRAVLSKVDVMGRGLAALASQTQKRDVQVLDLSRGFGDFERLP